jgi:hypothetical protein
MLKSCIHHSFIDSAHWVLGTGYWGRSSSPKIVNDSGSDYELVIVSIGSEQSYKIEASNSLLLPNVLAEDVFISLKLINEDSLQVYIPKKQIIDRHMKRF